MNFYEVMVETWKEGLRATNQEHLIGCGLNPLPPQGGIVKTKKKINKREPAPTTSELIKQEIKEKRGQLKKEGDRRRKAILSKEIEQLDKRLFKLLVAEKQQQELF